MHNIDSPGGRRDRLAVKEIMRRDGGADRQRLAQEKRHARAAKRAKGDDVIILSSYPDTEVHKDTPDGAYLNAGNQPWAEGRIQLIVVGPVKAPIDEYRKAVEQHTGKKLVLAAARKMESEAPEDDATVRDRGFLNLILEPDDGVPRKPIEELLRPPVMVANPPAIPEDEA